jgi:amino acid adenylation domain-containing protein
MNISTSTLTDCIKSISLQHANKTALEDHIGSYSYTELLEYSYGISNTLIDVDIRLGDRVVLLLNQGKAAVAAMLGVLQAGACFIPIDTKEPEERLQYIINDCKPCVILSDNFNETAIKAILPNTKIISIDTIKPYPNLIKNIPITPEAMAYIFYTSGSTGNPKGVCQNHRNVLHFVTTYADTLAITDVDRLSMLYSMNFSASNMDIFSGLLRGATVCFYDLKNRGTSDLENWLDSQKISVLHTVPSIFRHLLNNTTSNHVYKHIRAIDLGGEAVFNSDIKLLKQFFTDKCVCLNHLAATEASVIAQYKIDKNKHYQKGLLPVGPAASGMRITILNNNKPAPIDETGEIILESEYLSTGYWQQPELSDKVFGISSNGIRHYRSGDLGFFDAEGHLNYVGRNDFRVKINGQTIELGEIEASINALPDIDEAICIAYQEDETREKILIAFYITSSTTLTSNNLREALKSTLPNYMIPAIFIARESFPKTSTGKLDRKGIQPLAHELSINLTHARLAETTLEKNIALIFSSLLKTDVIDCEKTFFELGGSSLLAMNLIMLLEKNYRVDIPLELINKNASVAHIANHITTADSPSNTYLHQSLLTPLKVDNKPYNLFLVHGRDGHAMVSPDFANLLGVNHNVYTLRARGLKHGEKPNLSMEGMAAEYIREIRQIQAEGPYYLSGLCAGSVIALEMARQLTRVGEVVKPVIVFDPPFRSIKNPMSIDKKRTLVREMYQSLQSYNIEDYKDLANGLQSRVADGKIDLDISNEAELGATAHVVIGMNIAMNTYLPHPYEGDVLILCSKIRYERKKQAGDSLITGRLKHFVVGLAHDDVLDAKNPHFIAGLNQCLTIMINS